MIPCGGVRFPLASVSTLRESQLEALVRVWVHSPVHGALGTVPRTFTVAWSVWPLKFAVFCSATV
jgi:hypothetical protein